MADTKLTRIGNSPTVRGENGQIIATFFTENRYRLAGQMILIPEGIKLLLPCANDHLLELLQTSRGAIRPLSRTVGRCLVTRGCCFFKTSRR